MIFPAESGMNSPVSFLTSTLAAKASAISLRSESALVGLTVIGSAVADPVALPARCFVALFIVATADPVDGCPEARPACRD